MFKLQFLNSLPYRESNKTSIKLGETRHRGEDRKS
jgi:hypothetical protein